MSCTLDQLVPFHNSAFCPTAGKGSTPLNAIAAVASPAKATVYLAAFKSFTSVQADPFQTSVAAVLGGEGISPPATIAEVLLVPHPHEYHLAVFISATSVQLDPFQDSFKARPVLKGVTFPPKARPDV